MATAFQGRYSQARSPDWGMLTGDGRTQSPECSAPHKAAESLAFADRVVLLMTPRDPRSGCP